MYRAVKKVFDVSDDSVAQLGVLLHWVLIAVHVCVHITQTYGPMKDTLTGVSCQLERGCITSASSPKHPRACLCQQKKLFNKAAWKKAEGVLNGIKQGLLCRCPRSTFVL